MSEKKKKMLKLLLCIIFMLLAIYLIHYHYTYQVVRVVESDSKVPIIKEDENRKLITDIKKKYNNNEIVANLEIKNVFSTPIVQTDDNTFYLKHDLYRDSNEDGNPFLDYRNKSLNDKKIIIYGKESNANTDYTSIKNYQNQNYYNNHSIINLYTEEFKKSFKIFSCFIETEDFDYTNLNSYNGLTYYEHLNKLKSKSLYDTGVEIDNNSKIIVLELLTATPDNSKKTIVVLGTELPKDQTLPQ